MPRRSGRNASNSPKLAPSVVRAPLYADWSAGNLMMNSALPALLAAFETAAEPSERSVVEIEPALAERGRIHPFPA